MISNINGNGMSCKYVTKSDNSKDQKKVQEVNSTGQSAIADPQTKKLPHQVTTTVKTEGIVEKKVVLQKGQYPKSSSTDAESVLSMIQNSKKITQEAPPLVSRSEKPLAPVNTRSSDSKN